MRARGNRAPVMACALLVCGAVALGFPGAAAAAAPRIETMVVFKSGQAKSGEPRASRSRIRVGRRGRCAVAARTPLAALIRLRPGRLGVSSDSCSARPRDGGTLFVESIRRDRNRGTSGWVYKVGRRLGTAGAADPTGPFGNGVLRRGQRVLWFFCITRTGACQRTLGLRASVGAAGVVSVEVRGYDNEGKGMPTPGATLSIDGAPLATTDSNGAATVSLTPGAHTFVARKRGAIRSFAERVTVP